MVSPEAKIRPSLENDDMVRIAIGEVDVVHDGHDLLSFRRGETLEDVENLDLVAEVEVARRLVQENEGCLLGKGLGYHEIF